MTDLSLRIRELATRIGNPIPKPSPAPEPPSSAPAAKPSLQPPGALPASADCVELAAAAPAPLSPEPDPDAALMARLLGLPLEAFATADHCLEVRVPWVSEPLWFVPTEADAEDLAEEGIHRGRTWTASELRDLLAIPGITKAQARTIALTKLAFAGDVVAVEPRASTGRPAGTPREPAASTTWSGWPSAVPDLGPKRVGPDTPCGVCGVGTWVVYGEAPRCRPCATDAISASRTPREEAPE